MCSSDLKHRFIFQIRFLNGITDADERQAVEKPVAVPFGIAQSVYHARTHIDEYIFRIFRERADQLQAPKSKETPSTKLKNPLARCASALGKFEPTHVGCYGRGASRRSST